MIWCIWSICRKVYYLWRKTRHNKATYDTYGTWYIWYIWAICRKYIICGEKRGPTKQHDLVLIVLWSTYRKVYYLHRKNEGQQKGHTEKYTICIKKRGTTKGHPKEQQNCWIWRSSFCRGQTLENDKNMCLAEVIRGCRAPGGSTIIFL